MSSKASINMMVIPNLFKESKAKVEQILKKAVSTAITIDGWTPRGTII